MDDGIANRLVQARSIRGMSQLDLASRSGVAAAQISRYESGRSRPRTEVLAKLSKGLKVTLEWLLHGNPKGSGLEPFQAELSEGWAAFGSLVDSVGTTQEDLSKPSEKRFVRTYEDPIDLDPALLVELALQLSSFHSERFALQKVVERLEKVEGNFSVVDGIRRQLSAVESDILDTQAEIRKLVAD